MSGRSSPVATVTDSWPECHEFEPSAAKDPPCPSLSAAMFTLIPEFRESKRRASQVRRCSDVMHVDAEGKHDTIAFSNKFVNKTPYVVIRVRLNRSMMERSFCAFFRDLKSRQCAFDEIGAT
ncbi:hypothetical protein TNCV_3303041 [Trichonephila clavipes]|nr:hypothetical protein TNCV_3303041 [Trichonephila clavipes]